MPENIDEILVKIKENEQLKQYDFKILSYFDAFSTQVSGGYFRNSNIGVNSEWAARLVLYNDDPSVTNAFMITIGHEATHKENDYTLLKSLKKVNKKFINWIDEVHADFGAADKVADSSRNKLIASIDYKINDCKNSYKDYSSHPSWQRRRYYAENFDFNEQLIRQVAEDTGCKDEKLIQKVCGYYDDINLI